MLEPTGAAKVAQQGLCAADQELQQLLGWLGKGNELRAEQTYRHVRKDTKWQQCNAQQSLLMTDAATVRQNLVVHNMHFIAVKPLINQKPDTARLDRTSDQMAMA